MDSKRRSIGCTGPAPGLEEIETSFLSVYSGSRRLDVIIDNIANGAVHGLRQRIDVRVSLDNCESVANFTLVGRQIVGLTSATSNSANSRSHEWLFPGGKQTTPNRLLARMFPVSTVFPNVSSIIPFLITGFRDIQLVCPLRNIDL